MSWGINRYHSKKHFIGYLNTRLQKLLMNYINNPVNRNVPVTISLPLHFLRKLDSMNPGMHRSKFVLELIKKSIQEPTIK